MIIPLLLPIRALRLMIEFVPCVAITKVEAGRIRVSIPPDTWSRPHPQQQEPRSVKKRGDTIVGRVDMGKGKTTGENKYKFAVWMGDRHGWVVVPDSDMDDHVLICKVSDDAFKVNLLQSNTLYRWNGSEFEAHSIPQPNLRQPCPLWYARTPLPARTHVLDYFECGTCSTFLLNMSDNGTPQFAPALFDTRTRAIRMLTPRHGRADEFMFIMGCIQRSDCRSQFLVCSSGDPYTYEPHSERVAIMTVDTQDPDGPSFTLVETPLKIRRMAAVQSFLIHHLSDYNIFVADSNHCPCLLSYHPAEHLVRIHHHYDQSTWHFDVHQIPLPEDEDVDRISVSHNRIHLFTESGVYYSDFRLAPLGHSPFVRLENVTTPGTLDVELCGGDKHGILTWIIDEIEAVKERRFRAKA